MFFWNKIQFTGQHIYLEFVIASCADYRLGNLYLFRPSTSPLWGFSSCRLSFCYTCFHCLSGYSRPPSTTCSDVYCGGRKFFTRAGRRHALPRASRCCWSIVSGPDCKRVESAFRRHCLAFESARLLPYWQHSCHGHHLCPFMSRTRLSDWRFYFVLPLSPFRCPFVNDRMFTQLCYLRLFVRAIKVATPIYKVVKCLKEKLNFVRLHPFPLSSFSRHHFRSLGPFLIRIQGVGYMYGFNKN